MLTDIGGIFYEESTVGSGTGNYNSFLRLQATDEEDGVNTDDPNVGDNKGGIWTHSILISSLVQVEEDGTYYYEIRLDLNEGDAEGDPAIRLEDLRIFYSDDPATGDDYDDDFVNLTKVYDLGAAINLTDTNSGSGTDDYRFLIPVSLFANAEADDYFTLYSKFSGSEGGFEEWRAKSQDVGDGLPIIHVEKVAAPIVINEGTPTDILYTYELTNLSPGDDALTVTSFVDDNGTPGNGADDVDLMPYYTGGDTDSDGLLDKTETWTFSYTRQDTELDAGTLTNIATANGTDEEGNNTHDDDDAAVTVQDMLPTIDIVKTASPTQVQAGLPTSVTFTYAITNTSPTSTDPLTIASLVDDMGTVSTGDDVNLLPYYVSGDTGGDGIFAQNETWVFSYTTTVTLAPGQVRTNIVTVTASDDEQNQVSDWDDATVTAYNLGRTPGFWSNNGSLLWDGNNGTLPRGGHLGTSSIVAPGSDLAYTIHDLNGDGVDDIGAGSRGYLMIGDWNTNGIADANENVIVISRADALGFLNASTKQQQDARWVLARDVTASWLNYLGGSFVGDPNNADATSVVHHIDQAVAWLIEATADENHIFTRSELSTHQVTTSSAAWQTGYDFNLTAGVQHDVPSAGQHALGDIPNLDILGGAYIHSALDHYNNFGFI